eukprot:9212948-Pyramimonas_sp.AAC.1
MGPAVGIPVGLRSAVLGGAARRWSQPLWPSAGLPKGPRNAALGGAARMWSQPLGPLGNSPWGHGTLCWAL